jgi:hypothetical protein
MPVHNFLDLSSMAVLCTRKCDGCKKDYRGRGMRWCSHACRNKYQKIGFKGFPGNQFARGKHWSWSPESRAHGSLAQRNNPKCRSMLNKRHSIATRLKIAASHRARVAAGTHHAWKGGVTPLHAKLRLTVEYKIWRDAVFKRDNYTCQSCLIRNGAGTGNDVYLEAHHIQPFAQFPEHRFDISNGIALCHRHHPRGRAAVEAITAFQKIVALTS